MNKKLPLIAAVDFDDTLVETNPDFSIKSLKPHAGDVLRKWQKQGIYVIIWTCRTGDTQLEAEEFLKDHKIPFDKINDHSVYTYKDWPNATDSKKAYGDIYIDDKSPEHIINGMPSWVELDKMIQGILDKSDKWSTYPNTDYRYNLEDASKCKHCGSTEVMVLGYIDVNDDNYTYDEEAFNGQNYCQRCHEEDVL